jgi:hypothetical protein
MRVHTNGFVGVGTQAPTERLHVVGNGLFAGNLTVSGALNATLPAGSANYIQNATSPQAGASFNISGSGTLGGSLTANVVNASAQYNIAGQRVLITPGPAASNLYVGFNAGNATPSPGSMNNSFFGFNAGPSNTTGNGNSFFGTAAGFANTTGFSNSFYGAGAGNANTSGADNSFFGNGAGSHTTEANNNSFFGVNAGFNNTTGSENSAFGILAGFNNTTGSLNTFFGRFAGVSNTTENNQRHRHRLPRAGHAKQQPRARQYQRRQQHRGRHQRRHRDDSAHREA